MNNTTKPESIRKGDRFEDAKGRIWEVYETKPGGVVDLFCKAKSLSNETYTSCVRSWMAAGTFKRLPSVAGTEAK